MPALVGDPSRVHDMTEAYLALAGPTTTVPHRTAAVPRQARGAAETLIAADLHHQAIALLEAIFASADNDRLHIDLWGELVRAPLEHGDCTRTTHESKRLIPCPRTPAVTTRRCCMSAPSIRHLLARGRKTRHALAEAEALLADQQRLQAPTGPIRQFTSNLTSVTQPPAGDR